MKNPNYLKFKLENEMKIITIEHIERAMSNIKGIYGKHKQEGRALLVALYYSGARPNEILRIKGRDIIRDKSYIIMKVPPSKHGLPRNLHIPLRLKYAKELLDYAMVCHENMFIFYHYRTNYIRTRKVKDGIKIYKEITDKLRYHVYKWFEGVIDHSIPTYYLRHNRFTSLIQKPGISIEDIRLWKGAKSLNSVMPYLHFHTDTSRKIGKKLE